MGVVWHASMTPPTHHTHTHTHTHTDEVRPSLKVARIDSQSSDTQDGGEGVKKKRKKNRQHKKKPGGTSTDKELDQLRVMSK